MELQWDQENKSNKALGGVNLFLQICPHQFFGRSLNSLQPEFEESWEKVISSGFVSFIHPSKQLDNVLDLYGSCSYRGMAR